MCVEGLVSSNHVSQYVMCYLKATVKMYLNSSLLRFGGFSLGVGGFLDGVSIVHSNIDGIACKYMKDKVLDNNHDSTN